MRTTLTIDDDVAQQIERRMRERGTTFKATVNELLRRGLGADHVPVEVELPTFGGRLRPGVELTKALSLAAALEDEEIARKLELGT